MAGECNARIAKIRDYSCTDNFMFSELRMSESQTPINEKIKIIENLKIQLYRESKDTKTNTRWYTLIDIYRRNDLFILNGRYGEDKNVGQFTVRNKYVIEYVMATAQCFHLLHNFSITDTGNLFSDDHALLKWSLKSPFLNDKPPIGAVLKSSSQ